MTFLLSINILNLIILACSCSGITIGNLMNKVSEAVRTAMTQSIPNDYCFNNQSALKGTNNKLMFTAPVNPNQMEVKFLLFTCNNKDIPQNFTYLSDPNQWRESSFDLKGKTRFIVHGYTESYPGNIFTKWMQRMKDLFLNKSCDNVIGVDWSKPARSIYYYQSAYNTVIVGRMISCVINRWKNELNYSPENVHLIGHSLGGNVIGFAGKDVKDPKVRRITSLDPAGPGFQEYGDEHKLAFSDAKCVIAIHTNGAKEIPIFDGFGHLNPMGNIDFYPNGGQQQTGCSSGEVSGRKVTSTVRLNYRESASKTFRFSIGQTVCSHMRSNTYAIVDQNFVNTKCQLIGYICSSYEDFSLGKCSDCGSNGNGCKPMPISLDFWDNTENCDSNSKHLKYFLNTGNVETNEYCLFHYQIIITIKGTANTCLGEINIRLSSGKQIGVSLRNNNRFESKDGNQRFSKLYSDPKELETFELSNVDSTFDNNCEIVKIEINYMSNLDTGVRKTMSSVFCSNDGKSFSRNC